MASNDDYYDTDAGKRALAHYLSNLNDGGVNTKRKAAGWALIFWYVCIIGGLTWVIFFAK